MNTSERTDNQGDFLFNTLLFLLYCRLGVAAAGLNFALPIFTILILSHSLLITIIKLRISNIAMPIAVGVSFWSLSAIASWAGNAPLLNNSNATEQIVQLATYALFLNAITLTATNKHQLEKLTVFLKVFVVVGSILCIYQILTNKGFVGQDRTQIQRAFGTATHPVSYSLQILISIVGLEIIRKKSDKPIDRIYLGLFMISCVALALTFSRTGWLLFGFVFTSYYILSLKFFQRIAIAPFLVIIPLIAIISSDRFSDLGSLSFFFENYEFSSGVYDFRFVDNSISWRIANWSIALHDILEKPLIGYGPGQAVFISQFNLAIHNLFLEMLIEVGIFGFVGVLIMLIGFAISNRNSFEYKNQRVRQLWRLLLWALLFNISFSNSLIGQTATVLLLIMVIAIINIPDHESAEKKVGFL